MPTSVAANPTTSINLEECIIKYRLEGHESERPELKVLLATVTYPGQGKIASLNAVCINRYQTEDEFHTALGVDTELATWSTFLFDKLGRVRPDFIEPGYLRGSGCFCAELSSGNILYVQDIKVKSELCGIGIGSWILRRLYASEQVAKLDWIFCYPLPSYPIFSKMTSRQQLESTSKYNDFFRKNGFRRLGRTQYLCYSTNSSHASRLLLASNDIPYSACHLYYLEHPDRLEQDENTSVKIHVMLAEDGEHDGRPVVEIKNTEGDRCSPYPALHGASQKGEPTKVRTLLQELDRNAVAFALRDRDNPAGMTPLELCRSEMERRKAERERGSTGWLLFSRPSEFTGYDTKFLMTEAILKGATGDPSIQGLTDSEYIIRNKWGCTCGQCVDGWLSPRMKFRLEHASVTTYDMMDPSFYDMGFSLDMDPGLQYIPPRIVQRPKTFYKGYRYIFVAIYELLREQPPVIPSAFAVARKLGDALRGEWTPHDVTFGFFESKAVEFYVDKGGLVEFALDCITHTARDQAPITGDGTFDELFDSEHRGVWSAMFGETDPDETGDQEWMSLPTCANDLEFRMVRANLGLDEMAQWGPYSMFGGRPRPPTDFGVDGDEDEDDEDIDADEEEGEGEDEDEDYGEDYDEDEDEDEGDGFP